MTDWLFYLYSSRSALSFKLQKYSNWFCNFKMSSSSQRQNFQNHFQKFSYSSSRSLGSIPSTFTLPLGHSFSLFAKTLKFLQCVHNWSCQILFLLTILMFIMPVNFSTNLKHLLYWSFSLSFRYENFDDSGVENLRWCFVLRRSTTKTEWKSLDQTS